jgi:chromosome segregation ATPase
MTKSRLKFELLDGSEPVGSERPPRTRDLPPSKPPSIVSSSRRPPDMIINQLASLGQKMDTAEWPRKPDPARPTSAPSILDPSLLQDLAEGFEFLHRQLDDSESELERSREQSHAFEQDARRWEEEAARLRDDAKRLREESEETRGSLDKLRKDFEESRDGSVQQQQTVERIVDEMGEIRAARAHLEELAAEQQRALLLSLELLKRVSAAEQPASVAETSPVLSLEVQPLEPTADLHAAALEAKEQEIAELKRLVEAAGEEGTRVDNSLAETRKELESRNAAWHAAEAQIEGLKLDLAASSAEAESVRTWLTASQSELDSTRAELSLAREDSKRFEALAFQSNPQPDLMPRVKELENERARTAEKLQEAEAEIALQSAEVESRGAIITALESALEEQNGSLRILEERFLAYAEQVQSLQLQRLEMPRTSARGIASKFARIFSPPERGQKEAH